MPRPVKVTQSSFIEGSHTTKNTASGPTQIYFRLALDKPTSLFVCNICDEEKEVRPCVFRRIVMALNKSCRKLFSETFFSSKNFFFSLKNVNCNKVEKKLVFLLFVVEENFPSMLWPVI